MKYFSLILLLSLFACNSNSKKKSVEAENKSLLSNATNIPGTRLSIATPEGFSKMAGMTGFSKPDGSMIQIYDLIGGNYYTNAKDFNRQSFVEKGVIVLEFMEKKISDYPAKYAVLQNRDGMENISLVFGDSTFSVMVMAIYPLKSNKTAEAIKKSLATITYDKSKVVDPFESAAFKLDDSQTSFKYLKSSAGFFIYSKDGVEPEEKSNAPIFMAVSLPTDPSINMEQAAGLMLQKIGVVNTQGDALTNVSTKIINGYAAYQAEAKTTIKGKAVLIYVCTVSSGKVMVNFTGVSYSKNQTEIEEFRKLAKTVIIK